MQISKFTDKVNKLEGKIQVAQEEITITNGIYNDYLQHDNIVKGSLNIYTGLNLTGEKIESYTLSTPSDMPWKQVIKIIANVPIVYVTYDFSGDQIEAEDVNYIQSEIKRTQQEFNTYQEANDSKVEEIENKVAAVENNKADKEKVFTKEEVLQKIDSLINSAPGTLDTLNELATALGNDPNFATTIINILSNKVDKVEGEALINTTEWDNVISEITKAKGIFPSIDERFKNISNADSQDELYLTSNIGNNYSVTIPNLTELSDGYPLTVKFNAASTGAITLNPNLLGAKSVIDYFGAQVTNVRQGLIANLRYDAAAKNFQLLGKGGGGNAKAPQILKDATATVDSGPVTGVMPNNGATIIIPGMANKAIQEGYHNGSGYVAGDANLVSDNIKAGKSIFNISGKASVIDTADATVAASQMITGTTAYKNGSKITGTMPYVSPDISNHKNAINITAGAFSGDGANCAYIQVHNGNFLNGIDWYRSYQPYLLSQYIVSGANIFGVAGTAATYKKGTVTFNYKYTTPYSITVPNAKVIHFYDPSSSSSWHVLIVPDIPFIIAKGSSNGVWFGSLIADVSSIYSSISYNASTGVINVSTSNNNMSFTGALDYWYV